MISLCGKGIWLTYSYDLQRALEMATKIEATHLLVKVGHGPHYFPETARGLLTRVRSLGFHPLAWLHVTDRTPQAALFAIQRAVDLGYEAVVLFLGAALVTGRQLRPLAEQLQKAAIPLERMLIATPPLPYLPDPQALETLAPLCQGGWMPLCFPEWDASPERVIDRDVYQSLDALSLMWQTTPAVFPVLAPGWLRRETASFLPEELIPWTEAVIRHGVDFFSVYHAALAEKACWPILQAANLPCMKAETQLAAETVVEPGLMIAQPVYVTVIAGDTVGGLIGRHGLKRTLFWEWNGHLWDSRGLPRDSDYLQEGWRVRVK